MAISVGPGAPVCALSQIDVILSVPPSALRDRFIPAKAAERSRDHLETYRAVVDFEYLGRIWSQRWPTRSHSE